MIDFAWSFESFVREHGIFTSRACAQGDSHLEARHAQGRASWRVEGENDRSAVGLGLSRFEACP